MRIAPFGALRLVRRHARPRHVGPVGLARRHGPRALDAPQEIRVAVGVRGIQSAAAMALRRQAALVANDVIEVLDVSSTALGIRN